MQSAADYETIYAYVRRKYYVAATCSWDAVALRARAELVKATATREKVVTGTSSESGGSAQFQQKFSAMIELQAIEALLQAECADSLPPADPTGTIVNFGNRAAQF